jgi:parallel beta-helix repeat protein
MLSRLAPLCFIVAVLLRESVANPIIATVTDNLKRVYWVASAGNPGQSCAELSTPGSINVQARPDIGNFNLLGYLLRPVANATNVRYANAFSGADAGARIAACIADLPPTGGTCDARELEGAQSITSDVFSGVTKPGTLLLGAATYTVTAQQNVPSNWKIIGAGKGVTKFVTGTAGVEVFRLNDSLNAELSGFTLTGSGSTAGTSAELGIFVGGTSRLSQKVHIHDVEITNQTAAIYVQNVADVQIDHNFIHGQVWDIGESEGYGVLMESASHVVVSDNTFIDVPRRAIYFSMTSYCIAANNTFKGGHRSRIVMQSFRDTVWVEHNIVTGNTISNVALASGESDVAYGITISSAARNNVIEGNTILNAENGGILISADDTLTRAPSWNVISNNEVKVSAAAARGISMKRGSYNTISGNKLIGNNAAAIEGILVSGSSKFTATRNVIKGNSISDFAVGVGTAKYSVATEIEDNNIFNCRRAISLGAAAKVGKNTVTQAPP